MWIILGLCHHMCGNHYLMQLLLDSKARPMLKISLTLVTIKAMIRKTVTLYSKLHQTSSFAEGMCQFKSTLRPSNTVRPTASTDARSVTKSSGSSIFSSMSTLLLLHGVLHTNLASSAGTSGHTSLPTSAFITDAENALDRGGTSKGITPPNTPQGLRSNVPSTVRSSGASMQRKGA
jgi:hypothetical protein